MRCQNCGRAAPTLQVTLMQSIGVLVVRFHKMASGEFCRPCISKLFWEYTLITAALGWWGVISFFFTLFILPMNLVTYFRSLSLPDPGPDVMPLGGGGFGIPQGPYAPVAAGPYGAPSPAPFGMQPPPGPYARPLGTPSAYVAQPSSGGAPFFLGCGGLLGLLALGCTTIGFAMAAFPTNEEDRGSGFLCAGLAIGMIGLPAVLSASFGWLRHVHHRHLTTVIALSRLHAELSIGEVAQKTGTDESEARELLLEAVRSGYVAGTLDPARGALVRA